MGEGIRSITTKEKYENSSNRIINLPARVCSGYVVCVGGGVMDGLTLEKLQEVISALESNDVPEGGQFMFGFGSQLIHDLRLPPHVVKERNIESEKYYRVEIDTNEFVETSPYIEY